MTAPLAGYKIQHYICNKSSFPTGCWATYWARRWCEDGLIFRDNVLWTPRQPFWTFLGPPSGLGCFQQSSSPVSFIQGQVYIAVCWLSRLLCLPFHFFSKAPPSGYTFSPTLASAFWRTQNNTKMLPELQLWPLWKHLPLCCKHFTKKARILKRQPSVTYPGTGAAQQIQTGRNAGTRTHDSRQILTLVRHLYC